MIPALAWLLWLAPPQPTQQQPSFRTGVNLVVVSAVVVDDKGAPVRNLRAEDFEVREDGHPVPIAAFVPVSSLASGKGSTLKQEPRFVVLLLDDIQGLAGMYRTKMMARMFAARMGPRDVGAVISLNAGRATTATGPFQMLEAIDRFELARGDSTPPPVWLSMGSQKAHHAQRTVSDLSRQLATVTHRRKVLVYIGQAGVFEAEYIPGSPIPMLSPYWHDAIADAERSNVSVYIIDSAGLTGVRGEFAVTFARETGGETFTNTNYFDRAVEQVWQEAGVYYLLSYEPRILDDRPHKIDVRVGRKGVHVRARRARPPMTATSATVTPSVATAPTSSLPPGADQTSHLTPEPHLAPLTWSDPAPTSRQNAVELTAVIRRAAEYATAYLDEMSAIVAEEHYTQHVEYRDTRVFRREVRSLRSDLLVVHLTGDAGVTFFRDVFEVDGKPVRDRDDRLRRLFLEKSTGAVDVARKILDEGARYNLGRTVRNINLPLLPLMFLRAEWREGFTWKHGGDEIVEGIRCSRVDYAEIGRPTRIRQADTGRDMPSSGSFWIEAATGRVVSSTVSTGDQYFRMIASVLYRPSETLAVWAPAEMRERYTSRAEIITGVATYQNFRRFQVETEETIKIPK